MAVQNRRSVGLEPGRNDRPGSRSDHHGKTGFDSQAAFAEARRTGSVGRLRSTVLADFVEEDNSLAGTEENRSACFHRISKWGWRIKVAHTLVDLGTAAVGVPNPHESD